MQLTSVRSTFTVITPHHSHYQLVEPSGDFPVTYFPNPISYADEEDKEDEDVDGSSKPLASEKPKPKPKPKPPFKFKFSDPQNPNTKADVLREQVGKFFMGSYGKLGPINFSQLR